MPDPPHRTAPKDDVPRRERRYAPPPSGNDLATAVAAEAERRAALAALQIPVPSFGDGAFPNAKATAAPVNRPPLENRAESMDELNLSGFDPKTQEHLKHGNPEKIEAVPLEAAPITEPSPMTGADPVLAGVVYGKADTGAALRGVGAAGAETLRTAWEFMPGTAAVELAAGENSRYEPVDRVEVAGRQIVIVALTTVAGGVVYGVGNKVFGKLDDAKKHVDDLAKAGKAGETFRRSKAERRRALLRDAEDPSSGLSDEARQFIREHDGMRVPPGHEVSHETPLYTLPKPDRGTLDVSDNMKTQERETHRKRHQVGGDQHEEYGPPSEYDWNRPKGSKK